MFDIYIRVSRLGERTEDEATEVYEAQCRAWAAAHGVEIELVEEDTDVSGSVAVADRKLERLVQRVEAGESEGILTPWLDRFGRDLIEGALAYRRISLAGGRLVCTQDGIDSSRPGDKLQFNLRMAFAEEYLDRTRAVFHAGKVRAAERGVYLSGVVPFGYDKDDEGRLVVNEAEAKFVRELFRRRSMGESISALQRFMNGTRIRSRTGVTSVLRNRVYVGEMEVPTERKGKTRTVKNAVPPILTEAEWEAGQVTSKYTPNDGSLAKQIQLPGIAYCGGCNRRMAVVGHGPAGNRKVIFACTRPDCTAHASLSCLRLEEYVLKTVQILVHTGAEHIMAVLSGEEALERATQAVEDARRAFEEYRDEIELQRVLGVKDFAAGLKTRKEALELARKAASRERHRAAGNPIFPLGPDGVVSLVDLTKRVVDRVVVTPVPRGRGRWTPVEDRVTILWHGSE
jgi:site-specific DNA recombinase